MRTTINIPNAILDDLMEYTDSKTKTDAVNTALKNWVRYAKIQKLKSLRGKLQIDADWKKLRALEKKEIDNLG